MDHALEKSQHRSMLMISTASLAVVLCLTVQVFQVYTSIEHLLAAESDRNISRSLQREVALASLEKQSRVRSKVPRGRHVQFGAPPVNRSTDMCAANVHTSPVEARYKTLQTRTLPNDRAPPPCKS